MQITGCGMRDFAFTIDVSEAPGETRTFEVHRREGTREELESSGFPASLMEVAVHAMSRSRNPGEFMKAVKASEFRERLDWMRTSTRMTFDEALSVLATVLVAEPVMCE